MSEVAVPEKHTHQPCGHKDRCSGPRGGCQKCARDRHLVEERERNRRNGMAL